jgi:hypothetical protein
MGDGRIRLAELHWYEAHGVGKREVKRKRFWTRGVEELEDNIKFAVCVDNDGYPASLELHKIYRVLPDEGAGSDADLRVIDESGEDYLYPAERFVLLELPQAVEKSLLQHA